MFIFDINYSIFTTMLISDVIHVSVISKKAILDIWNNIDIRNTLSDIKNYIFY